jgi:ABC-type multidrug transport system permease subunit
MKEAERNSYSGVARMTHFFLALIAIAVVALIAAFACAAFKL